MKNKIHNKYNYNPKQLGGIVERFENLINRELLPAEIELVYLLSNCVFATGRKDILTKYFNQAFEAQEKRAKEIEAILTEYKK